MRFFHPLLLLLPLSAAEVVDMFFYPTHSCLGPAIGCRRMPPYTCCSSGDIPYVSARTSTPAISGRPGNDNLRHFTCAYPLCESVCLGPVRVNTCVNPPWALFSTRVAQFREPPYIPSNDELVEYTHVPATEKDKCMQANAVLYIDGDGNEVVAEIPEARKMEVVGAVKRGDVEVLKGLGGEKREVVPFEVVELRRVDVGAEGLGGGGFGKEGVM